LVAPLAFEEVVRFHRILSQQGIEEFAA